MKDNISYLGLEMRIEIPYSSFDQFVNQKWGKEKENFPVNRVIVSEDSPYFEKLRVCGVFERQKEERFGVSFGICSYGGMAGRGGIIFIPKAELVYAKEKIPFIVHSDIMGAVSNDKNLEISACERCNNSRSWGDVSVVSPDRVSYTVQINSPRLSEKDIRKEYGRLCLMLHED